MEVKRPRLTAGITSAEFGERPAKFSTRDAVRLLEEALKSWDAGDRQTFVFSSFLLIYRLSLPSGNYFQKDITVCIVGLFYHIFMCAHTSIILLNITTFERKRSKHKRIIAAFFQIRVLYRKKSIQRSTFRVEEYSDVCSRFIKNLIVIKGEVV